MNLRNLKITTIPPQADGTPSPSPIVGRYANSVLHIIPADTRTGFRPRDTRPMPRHKVLTGYLHILDGTMKELADLVNQALADKSYTAGEPTPPKRVSPSIISKWRTEPAFKALVERARSECVETLKKAFDGITSGEEFKQFLADLRLYHPDVMCQVWDHAEEVAKTTGDRTRETQASLLFCEYADKVQSAKLARLWRQDLFPLHGAVDRIAEQHANALRDGNLDLARDLFMAVAKFAHGHAMEIDAKVERAAEREEARQEKQEAGRRKPKARKGKRPREK